MQTFGACGGGERCKRTLCTPWLQACYQTLLLILTDYTPYHAFGQHRAVCIVLAGCTWWGGQHGQEPGHWLLCHSNWCEGCRKTSHVKTDQLLRLLGIKSNHLFYATQCTPILDYIYFRLYLFFWQNHEDFEFKKLLMNILVLISADSASCRVWRFLWIFITI